MTERTKSTNETNLISDVLETLRFKGSIFFHSNLSAPWGVLFPPAEIPRFHIALDGECFVGAENGDTIHFQKKEIVMLPTGQSHWIADQPGRNLIHSDSIAEKCQLNANFLQEGKITNTLMCGMVSFDQNSSHPILESLPHILHFSHKNTNSLAWNTATLINSEIKRLHGKDSSIIDRLTEVLFIQLLEDYRSKNNDSVGFFAALRDQRLKNALNLIHQHTNRNWSIDSLGKEIGMSRSTLNRHFQNTIGVSPITYIQNWKMLKAYNLIRFTNHNIEYIADQVGFSSARTLNKAFSRKYHLTPSQLRKSYQP